MATHHRTKGFFLAKKERGESDYIFTVYTEDFGKLEVLGKAIRKIKSKLRSGAELFYLSEIEFIQGKTYKTLTDALLIENFPNIRKDLEKLETVSSMCQTLQDFVSGEEKDDHVWNLLSEVMAELEKPGSRIFEAGLIYDYFFWNLVSILGYRPELYSCCLCQKKPVPEELFFSFETGGVLCSSCSGKAEDSLEIGADAVKIIRLILKKDVQTLSRLKFDPANMKMLKKLSECYNKNI